jgi:hypothetical protein
MLERLKERYRQQGRDEQLSLVIEKFELLYDQHYALGDAQATGMIVEMVAWLQDDWEALDDSRI